MNQISLMQLENDDDDENNDNDDDDQDNDDSDDGDNNYYCFTCGGPLNRMDLGWYFPSVGFSSSFPLPSFPVSRARSRADP